MFPVCFQLVNEDGSSYQGSGVDKVSLLPGADIFAFRDAVKGKCPNLLTSVDASQLKVYKTVAAILGEEEALTLDEEADIGELKLGQSKKEALAVVVPVVDGISQGESNIAFCYLANL
jgi:hypothetical protein